MPGGWFIVQQVVEAVIGVVSILGNGLVLYVICKHQSLRSITNYIIASLAFADFIVGVVGIPCVIINNLGLPRNFYGCLIMNSAIVSLAYISVFNLVAVAIERFLAIGFPLLHMKHFTGHTAMIAIILSWLAGIVVGILPVLGWNMGPSNITDDCVFVFIMDYEYLVYGIFFGFFIPPLALIYASYSYIFYLVYKSTRASINTAVKLQLSSNTVKTELRTAKKIFIIIILFTFCWMPLHIVNSITYYWNQTNVPTVIIAVILSHANSAINPFIYVYGNAKFKVAFSKIWFLKWYFKQTQEHSSSSNPDQTGSSLDAAPAQPKKANHTSLVVHPQAAAHKNNKVDINEVV